MTGKHLRTAAVLFSGVMALTPLASMPVTVMADTAAPTVAAAAADKSGYVLMNIPYADFYKAEGYDKKVDAVTSATKTKTRAYSLTAGTYHVNTDGSDITGVVYPVKVDDLSALEKTNYTRVNDDQALNYTITLRGTATAVNLKGRQTLYQNASYAYYVLGANETPQKYLNATVKDGKVTITSSASPLQADERIQGVTGAVTYNGSHHDTEIALTGIKETAADNVSGIVLTYTDNGTKKANQTYVLRHLDNIWRGTEIGFDKDELNNVTITNIRYITQSAVRDYPVSITVKPYYNGKVTAAFNSAADAVAAKEDRIALTGVPANLVSPKATVYYTEGTGHDAKDVNVAENVTVNNGTVALGKFVDRSKTYKVKITSSNIADIISQDTVPVKFTDVAYANQYFFTSVYWANGKSIVNGKSGTTFAPRDKCTREEFVTFLWRYAGSPEPATSQVPFTDVKDSTRYSYKAILWAYGKGYVSGTSGTLFDSKADVTRAQAMTILYRYAGEPKNDTASSFTDVSGKYYTNAVNWAAAKGVTNGKSATTFAPDEVSQRGQTVTFLYNLSNLK